MSSLKAPAFIIILTQYSNKSLDILGVRLMFVHYDVCMQDYHCIQMYSNSKLFSIQSNKD